MKINKYVSVLGIATSLALVSCEDTEPEVLLTDCQQATSVFVDAETLFEEEVTICGTSAANLQEKLDELEARNTLVTNEFNADDSDEPVASDQINIPAGQPVAATGGSTLTFDEMVDFTFGEENSANTFSNVQSVINAEVTPGDEPAATPDQSLQVEITPSTLNDAGDDDQGFYFAGTTLELDNLGLDLVDFSGANKVITANVYSEVPVGFRVQVSSATGDPLVTQTSPAPGFKQVQHSGSGWEQIEIDFNSGVSTVFGLDGVVGGMPQSLPIDGVYNILQFQFEGLPSGVLSRLFVDNVVYNQVGGTVVIDEPVILPDATSFIRFDNADLDYLGNSFSFGDLSSVNIIENPAPGGSNPESSMVVEAIVDTNLANGFNGFGFDVEAIGLDLFDFSGDNKTFTVSVWSDIPFTLQVQISNGRDEAGVDIISPRPAFKTAPHSGGGWEDITFDFSTGPLFNVFSNNPAAPAGASDITGAEIEEITGTYNSIQFQFNGAPAAAMTTFYIDNVSYN